MNSRPPMKASGTLTHQSSPSTRCHQSNSSTLPWWVRAETANTSQATLGSANTPSIAPTNPANQSTIMPNGPRPDISYTSQLAIDPAVNQLSICTCTVVILPKP